jgi:hypothetical protein
MRPPNVNLVEMANPSITGGDGDILELDIHVIFGCDAQSLTFLLASRGHWMGNFAILRTFEEPASVYLAGGDLESDDVAL